jgi:hypothetical protein
MDLALKNKSRVSGSENLELLADIEQNHIWQKVSPFEWGLGIHEL